MCPSGRSSFPCSLPVSSFRRRQISQRTIIDMAADRGVYIDQSQSLNIHMTNVTPGKLTSMHFHAWKKGLKTGMYYLRTKPAQDAIKFTLDPLLIKKQAEEAETHKILQREKSLQGMTPRTAVSMSGPAAFQAATSGLAKLAVSSPVKQAPNPRGMEPIISPASEQSTQAYTMVPLETRTPEEMRAARARREQEIRDQEAAEEQGSCKGGMCSA
ncbi:MAG: hypothetical protein P4L99_02665 [Chthoniobacter sp.]|nr:hypothetical protein [Chthoniobacter sp.]